jgi:hypothetical protein
VDGRAASLTVQLQRDESGTMVAPCGDGCTEPDQDLVMIGAANSNTSAGVRVGLTALEKELLHTRDVPMTEEANRVVVKREISLHSSGT